MTTHDTIKGLLDECVQMLKDDGWTETKFSHFRKDGVGTAIEVGYVYGECTVRFQELGGRSGQVDVGTLHTMRGHDSNLKIDLAAHLDQLNHGARMQGLPLHRTEANIGVRCSTCDGGGCLDCTDPA